MSKLENKNPYQNTPTLSISQNHLNIENINLPVDCDSLIRLNQENPELANRALNIVDTEQKNRHLSTLKKIKVQSKAISSNMLNIVCATVTISVFAGLSYKGTSKN